MITSKSPCRVLQVAYHGACEALPTYRHKFNPKKFTQQPLLAGVVPKEFLCLDYRGLAQHLIDHPDLGLQIHLEAVPHFTTFQKVAVRLLAAVLSTETDATGSDWECEFVTQPHGDCRD